jgi:hypothetical protein
MTASVVVSQNQRKKGVWWAFPFHQLLSTVGISVLAALNYFRCLISLASSLDPDRNALFSNTDSAGILHRIRSPALSSSLADEVDLGASFLDLMYSFVLTPLPLVGRTQRYFGWGCRPELRCFVQLAVTLPFYTAASYSLAAFLSRTIQKHKQQHETAR